MEPNLFVNNFCKSPGNNNNLILPKKPLFFDRQTVILIDQSEETIKTFCSYSTNLQNLIKRYGAKGGFVCNILHIFIVDRCLNHKKN